MTHPSAIEYFTVIDNHLRGDGKGTHHAALVGPGLLCDGARAQLVEAVGWEHGIANVDCHFCLEVLALQQPERCRAQTSVRFDGRDAQLVSCLLFHGHAGWHQATALDSDDNAVLHKWSL